MERMKPPAARRKKNISRPSFRNRVTLLRGGKAFFDRLLEMIEGARESIHLQTYIYEYDETGKAVAQALVNAAKRKVDVHLLVDGYASKALPRSFLDELKQAGVNFRFFNPLFKSKRFYFGRRLHHKVVVADTKYALVGGINISNRYNDMPEEQAWLDFAVHVEGEVARDLCILCWKTWNNYPMNMDPTPCERGEIEYDIPPGETCEVAMRRNDWVRRKNEISTTYVEMFRTAQSHIVILCSYFLPGRFIRRQLKEAARRGVKITVITAGISDVLTAKYAERFMYGWMLRYNIELYEFQPCVLHGKIAACDGKWMTIGSYNINDISAYASVELNINIRNDEITKAAEKLLLDIAEKDCIHITREYYLHTSNIFKKFARWLAYRFIRIVFYLFTFYFKRGS